MSVEVLNETETAIDVAEFAQLGRFVLDSLNVHPQAELVISFVEVPTMTDLHVRFLDEPGPTDVMSFPMDELRPGWAGDPAEAGILGDVVICPEVAAVQAAEFGHSLVDEMLVLATHGILHLLGFDHAEPDERDAMFALQRKLVLAFLATSSTRGLKL
ncbi:MAG: rRNA maturation RNase YbeY [Bifidobacteriaceae bacterium]|jgi:probable rRNA maturation factor|nr:rRNA maturation RNase YbeY [Bifidobacteriaceae bacterium]